MIRVRRTTVLVVAPALWMSGGCAPISAVDQGAGVTPATVVQPSEAATPRKPNQPRIVKRDMNAVRVVEAPVEKVWRVWTDCEELKRWWGPRGYTSHECQIDFREGGRFVWHMRAPAEQGGGDLYLSGVYTKIVPQQRFEFVQGLADREGNRIDPATLGMPTDFPREIPSAVTFTQMGPRTEVVAWEYGQTVGPMLDQSELGLNETLDKMAALFR